MSKTIVITGASSGIGKAIYDHYNGIPEYQVFGLSRRGPIKCEIPFDIWGRDFIVGHTAVDLLVNSAGIMPLPELHNKIFEIMEVNFWGVVGMMNCCTFNPGACVINIASVSAHRPDEHLPVYAASKAAVIAYSKAMAKQMAPKVRVNTISPGFYDTNLVPGELPQNLLQTIPMGFEDQPKNLVSVVDLIWKHSYITGADFIIDGGVSI